MSEIVQHRPPYVRLTPGKKTHVIGRVLAQPIFTDPLRIVMAKADTIENIGQASACPDVTIKDACHPTKDRLMRKNFGEARTVVTDDKSRHGDRMVHQFGFIVEAADPDWKTPFLHFLHQLLPVIKKSAGSPNETVFDLLSELIRKVAGNFIRVEVDVSLSVFTESGDDVTGVTMVQLNPPPGVPYDQHGSHVILGDSFEDPDAPFSFDPRFRRSGTYPHDAKNPTTPEGGETMDAKNNKQTPPVILGVAAAESLKEGDDEQHGFKVEFTGPVRVGERVHAEIMENGAIRVADAQVVMLGIVPGVFFALDPNASGQAEYVLPDRQPSEYRFHLYSFAKKEVTAITATGDEGLRTVPDDEVHTDIGVDDLFRDGQIEQQAVDDGVIPAPPPLKAPSKPMTTRTISTHVVEKPAMPSAVPPPASTTTGWDSTAMTPAMGMNEIASAALASMDVEDVATHQAKDKVEDLNPFAEEKDLPPVRSWPDNRRESLGLTDPPKRPVPLPGPMPKPTTQMAVQTVAVAAPVVPKPPEAPVYTAPVADISAMIDEAQVTPITDPPEPVSPPPLPPEAAAASEPVTTHAPEEPVMSTHGNDHASEGSHAEPDPSAVDAPAPEKDPKMSLLDYATAPSGKDNKKNETKDPPITTRVLKLDDTPAGPTRPHTNGANMNQPPQSSSSLTAFAMKAFIFLFLTATVTVVGYLTIRHFDSDGKSAESVAKGEHKPKADAKPKADEEEMSAPAPDADAPACKVLLVSDQLGGIPWIKHDLPAAVASNCPNLPDHPEKCTLYTVSWKDVSKPMKERREADTSCDNMQMFE